MRFYPVLETFRAGIDEDGRGKKKGEVQRRNYDRKAPHKGDLTNLQVKHWLPGPLLLDKGCLVESADADFS